MSMVVNVFLFFVPLLCLLSSPDSSQSGVTIRFPSQRSVLVSASGASIVGEYDSTAIVAIQVLSRFQTKKSLEIGTKDQKENFAREFRSIFPDNFILERLQLKTHEVKTGEKVKEYNFALSDKMILKNFWSSTQLKEVLRTVYDNKVLFAELTLMGWEVRNIEVSLPSYRQRFGNTFAFSASLTPGKNMLYVQGIDRNGGIIGRDSVLFFFKTSIEPTGPSSEFVHETFHTENNEKKCSACHRMSVSEVIRRNKSSVEKECKVCHAVLLTQKSSHSPAAEWNCLMCHDPNSSPKYRLYSGKKYDSSLCFECHSDMQEIFSSHPSTHAPAASGDCLTCHDVHGAQQENLLVAKVNTVCNSCHEGISQNPHPVVGHPLQGMKNPLAPGKEFNCATCHHPHSSVNELLLIAPKAQLCQRCHQF